MTVPGARGHEAVLAYSGGTIDRASNQRTDQAWLDATLAAPGARVVLTPPEAALLGYARGCCTGTATSSTAERADP